MKQITLEEQMEKVNEGIEKAAEAGASEISFTYPPEDLPAIAAELAKAGYKMTLRVYLDVD